MKTRTITLEQLEKAEQAAVMASADIREALTGASHLLAIALEPVLSDAVKAAFSLGRILAALKEQ